MARVAADRAEAAEPGRPALRDGRARADQPDGLDLARCVATRARATSPSTSSPTRTQESARGPDRGRRRPAGDRDDLRHAQREGRDLRGRGRLRRARRPDAADHLGHDHRRLGPDALRPDRRGVLDLGRPRPADRGRAQLRARGAAAARPRRRPRPDRRDPGHRLPERRAAQRVRRLRRGARRPPRELLGQYARDGLDQHRRRLLRDHPGPRPGDRGGRRGHRATRDPRRRAQDPAVRAPGR